MAAVFGRAAEVEELVVEVNGELGREGLGLAAYNGLHQVVSGEVESVDRLLERCESAGVRAERLRVSHGFHSGLMEPVLDELEGLLAGVEARGAEEAALVSNVTGRVMGSGERMDGVYWRRHAREAVAFGAGVASWRRWEWRFWWSWGLGLCWGVWRRWRGRRGRERKQERLRDRRHGGVWNRWWCRACGALGARRRKADRVHRGAVSRRRWRRRMGRVWRWVSRGCSPGRIGVGCRCRVIRSSGSGTGWTGDAAVARGARRIRCWAGGTSRPAGRRCSRPNCTRPTPSGCGTTACSGRWWRPEPCTRRWRCSPRPGDAGSATPPVRGRRWKTSGFTCRWCCRKAWRRAGSRGGRSRWW